MGSVSRRRFVGTGAAAAAGLSLGSIPVGAASTVPGARATRPTVIASANGLRGVALAYGQLTKGADPLDAAIAGVNIQELDPEDQSVGLGGLPNADGVVQLDASCMHGPTRRAGAVASLEGIATPSLVAKAVMELTDHILLVGEGAKRFALSIGFKEQDLMTERTRQEWLRWRSRQNANDAWLDYEGEVRYHTGTINMNAVNATGDVGSVTTTSGMAWKIPGRAGDSPILGAGLYVDNDVGAAGSTGRGEANLYNLSSYLIVESMRRGMSPKDAGMEALRRIKGNTIDRRLLNARGEPNFNIRFFVLNKRGEWAGVSMYAAGETRYALCTERGVESPALEPLLQGAPTD